ncbi:MAG: hypothetical protein QJR01_04480 [Kyrpidia sp.]|nr:hypothetical protein [Kyrpidia sp.]
MSQAFCWSSCFLPCKIVVYRDGDQTKIGLPRPTMLLGQASEDPGLREIAGRVEEQLSAAVNVAAGQSRRG